MSKITLRNLNKKTADNKVLHWNTGLAAVGEPHATEVYGFDADNKIKVFDGDTIGHAVVTRTLYPISAEKLGTIAVAIYGRYGTMWIAPGEEATISVSDVEGTEAAIAYYKKLGSESLEVLVDGTHAAGAKKEEVEAEGKEEITIGDVVVPDADIEEAALTEDEESRS